MNAPAALAPRDTNLLAATRRPWIIVAGQILTTGGQDRANYALASWLSAHDNDVHLVSHEVDSQLTQQSGVTCHGAERPFRSDLLGEPFLQLRGTRLARQFASQRPFVVCNGGNCDWPDVNWVHYVHAAYPRSEAGSTLRRLRMRLSHRHWLANERRALSRARVIIANSQRTKRDLIEKLGIDAERIVVVYYGIDPQAFRPPIDDERARTRQEMHWSLDRPVVMFVGALGDHRKGFDTLFDAWTLLRRDEKSLDPLLVVIGRGAMLGEWERRAAAAGLAGSVSFLGFREDVPQLMRAADALVAPTRYEAYGLGVQEALACGLPSIVSADSGVAERYPASLRHLLLHDVDDATELAGRIAASLSHRGASPALTAFAGQIRARTWDSMAQEIEQKVCAAP